MKIARFLYCLLEQYIISILACLLCILCRLLYGLGVCIYLFLLPRSCQALRVPLTVPVALLGLLVFSVIGIACHTATSILSSLGSLTRPRPRDNVIVCAYIHLITTVLEMGWLIFSLYAAASSDYSSAGNIMDVGVASGMGEAVLVAGSMGSCSVILQFSVSVGLAWFMSLLILLVFMCGLDPCGCCLGSRYIKHVAKSQEPAEQEYENILKRSLTDYGRHDNMEGHYSNQVNSTLLWAKFRQIFFCCRRGDSGVSMSKKSALGDVANILRLLFSDVDVTTSDLLAGYLLVGRYQENLRAGNENRDHELTKVSLFLPRILVTVICYLYLISGNSKTAQREEICGFSLQHTSP